MSDKQMAPFNRSYGNTTDIQESTFSPYNRGILGNLSCTCSKNKQTMSYGWLMFSFIQSNISLINYIVFHVRSVNVGRWPHV